MDYLLDTSVLSLVAPGRPPLSDEEAELFRREAERMFVPAIVLADIMQGIAKLERLGSPTRADSLAGWLETLIRIYGERVLAFDAAAACAAGKLADAAAAKGRHPGFPDVAIAAIAKTKGLTVLTKNLRRFEPLGVPCRDPFARDGD